MASFAVSGESNQYSSSCGPISLFTIFSNQPRVSPSPRRRTGVTKLCPIRNWAPRRASSAMPRLSSVMRRSISRASGPSTTPTPPRIPGRPRSARGPGRWRRRCPRRLRDSPLHPPMEAAAAVVRRRRRRDHERRRSAPVLDVGQTVRRCVHAVEPASVVRCLLAQRFHDTPVDALGVHVARTVGGELVQGRTGREPVAVAVAVEVGRARGGDGGSRLSRKPHQGTPDRRARRRRAGYEDLPRRHVDRRGLGRHLGGSGAVRVRARRGRDRSAKPRPGAGRNRGMERRLASARRRASCDGPGTWFGSTPRLRTDDARLRPHLLYVVEREPSAICASWRSRGRELRIPPALDTRPTSPPVHPGVHSSVDDSSPAYGFTRTAQVRPRLLGEGAA